MTGRRAGLAAAALLVGQGLPATAALRRPRMLLAPRLSGVGRPGHLALTFDDGPDPGSTPHVLRELDRLGLRATFFLVGEAVRRHPGAARDVVRAGHEVGVHGEVHRPLLLEPPGRTGRSLARAARTVQELTGARPRWFRPPHGIPTTAALLAARRLGLAPVLWTAWGRDWLPGCTAASVLGQVRAGRLDGGTLLLHDASASGAWRATVAALPAVAALAAERGLAVGPLAEHWPGTGRAPADSGR